MADCELLASCQFFTEKRLKMPTVAEMMKTRLCHGDHSQCARYIVYEKLGRSNVPEDLSPVDVERANKILFAGS